VDEKKRKEKRLNEGGCEQVFTPKQYLALKTDRISTPKQLFSAGARVKTGRKHQISEKNRCGKWIDRMSGSRDELLCQQKETFTQISSRSPNYTQHKCTP
jgi:hypothetical protein